MSIKRVSPEEAKALVDTQGYVYVDVRSIPEFEAGHPTGAYNIPVAHMTPGGMRPNPDFLSEVAAVFPADTKLVLGCKAGGRSLRAAQALSQAGYSDLVDQRAGFSGARDGFGQLQEAGWQAAGLDVATEAEPGRSYGELTGKNDG
ncbi:MAG: rhodanese-like domain-containing protein [Polyangiales bacterium]